MCMAKQDHAHLDEMKIRISGVDSVLFKLLNHGRHGCFVLHVERDFPRFGTGAYIDAGTSISLPITGSGKGVVVYFPPRDLGISVLSHWPDYADMGD